MTDRDLAKLLVDHWELAMRSSPVLATELGDHRYDTELPRYDRAALDAYVAERDALRARAHGLAVSDPRDRVTLGLFSGELDAEAATDVCHDEQWKVSIRDNPYAELADVVEQHKLRSREDYDNLLVRLAQGARMIDDQIANLGEGLSAGRVAAAEAVRRTIAQLDGELAKPVEQWSMHEPAASEHAHGTSLRGVLDGMIRPAIARYRDFLRERVLPRGRSGADEGIGALPDGDACYRAEILSHLGLAKAPTQLHELGLSEIERIDRELAALGARALGTRDLAETVARLRGDRALYFTTGEELIAASQAALDRAKGAIPRWFGRLPKTDCIVSIIPEHEAPYTTVAYYQQPHPDGTKPGEFFINTFAPETRPRFELAALAAHESIPGHHLQIAIAQELGELPSFRKYGGSTAYVEGWALYTERLADEMGLYESDLDRLGMLSYDAWRASRLVVDTGLHAMRWTREQAEAFMMAHTALTRENVSNEVDRYIGWPGQALAYKVGQLEIFALRADAERKLGTRFDLRGFHDVLLEQGAVTLPVLREQVAAWVAAR